MACNNSETNQKGYKQHRKKFNINYYQIFLLFIIFLIKSCSSKPVGYSYSKFSGPVSGPEKEIFLHNEHGQHPHVDYIAKPDYHFSYGVEDPKTKVLQNREESRNGDAVKGEYSVIDPDGTHRIVRYTADKVNGFQAEVITDGKSSTLHGHHKTHYSPVPVNQHEQNYQQQQYHHHNNNNNNNNYNNNNYNHNGYHHHGSSSNDNDRGQSQSYTPPSHNNHESYDGHKNHVHEDDAGDDDDDDDEDDDTY